MTKDIIWDPIVRLFHWSVALLFLLNYFILEEGSDWHEWAGYYILGALVVRIVWGFMGSPNARFISFFPSYKKVKHHITLMRSGIIPEDNGHNPVGALMIFALLFCLLITGLSGWSLDGWFWGEDWAENIHEIFANTTFTLVVIHIFAVVFFSIKGPRNLIVQMVTGKVAKQD